ncbi:stefin-C [Galendromus occidentalis]|uniref:Stefin-C n=1 Tax=Galendromus occidentalis TaxID=34638 RepID=A0AAJ6QWQ9_9ACAR|nr:stefin-C [Galendromus occidentalis]
MEDVPVLGGLGETKEVSDDVRDLTEKVRAEAEEKAGKKFEVFEPVKYKTQVVAGTNYFIKVKVGEDDYIHVRAHRSLKNEVSLWGVQEGKKAECAIEHFQ